MYVAKYIIYTYFKKWEIKIGNFFKSKMWIENISNIQKEIFQVTFIISETNLRNDFYILYINTRKKS